LRKLDKAIIWPVYFDSNKSRKDGRRVSKVYAVPSPKIVEVSLAVERLSLKNEVRLDEHYPKAAWVKSGMILVEKKEPKEKILLKIAKQLIKVRSETVKKQ
jgi:signal recognition particle subunit SRP19